MTTGPELKEKLLALWGEDWRPHVRNELGITLSSVDRQIAGSTKAVNRTLDILVDLLLERKRHRDRQRESALRRLSLSSARRPPIDLSELTDGARYVASLFSYGPGSRSLTVHSHDRVTDRGRQALEELVQLGILKAEETESGAVVYTPRFSTRKALTWVKVNRYPPFDVFGIAKGD